MPTACVTSYQLSGRMLEYRTRTPRPDLIAFLIEPLPGVVISDENAFNIGQTEEKDMWLHHPREPGGDAIRRLRDTR